MHGIDIHTHIYIYKVENHMEYKVENYIETGGSGLQAAVGSCTGGNG